MYKSVPFNKTKFVSTSSISRSRWTQPLFCFDKAYCKTYVCKIATWLIYSPREWHWQQFYKYRKVIKRYVQQILQIQQVNEYKYIKNLIANSYMFNDSYCACFPCKPCWISQFWSWGLMGYLSFSNLCYSAC